MARSLCVAVTASSWNKTIIQATHKNIPEPIHERLRDIFILDNRDGCLFNSHGLGEVAWLIHILALVDSYVVSEQLQGD